MSGKGNGWSSYKDDEFSPEERQKIRQVMASREALIFLSQGYGAGAFMFRFGVGITAIAGIWAALKGLGVL